jgi:hypothetical protein
MAKTRAQIQAKAIAILVGGDVGFNPSDEDATTMDGYIDSEVAELNADGTIYIGDPDSLDDELFTTFCKLVANAAAEEFGGKSDEKAALLYRNRIRVIARQTPGYGPQTVEYF